MKNRFLVLFLFFFAIPLFSSVLDDDIDGIENHKDQCPNSSITDIVDDTGCIIERLSIKQEHHFEILLGYEYTKVDNTTSLSAQSLSLSYYHGDTLSFSFYTTNYDLISGENNIADSTLQLHYDIYHHDKYSLNIGLGMYLPTFDIPDNKTDYFVHTSLNKEVQAWDFSFFAQHTFMKDTFTQDTTLLSASIGKVWHENIYTTLSYSLQNSIYAEEDYLHYIAFDGSYYINEHFFLTSTLSLGLNTASIQEAYQFSLGYRY